MSAEQIRKARQYVAEFRIAGAKPTFVELDNGERIEFETMTDEQAIDVAEMLQSLEMEAEHRGCWRMALRTQRKGYSI